MISKNARARQEIDVRLQALKPVSRFAVPSRGWIRAIRDALGMTAGQLGERMEVRAQSVLDLERSEAAGKAQLDSLRKAAAALDCTLVYALVPNSSLEEIVSTRARAVARRDLSRVDHTMELEAQVLPEEEREARIDAYIREHLRLSDIWKTR